MRCFRIDPSSEDPVRLLSGDGQWTEPWGGSEDGQPCDKCEGQGQTDYTCWSCVLTGARSSMLLPGWRDRKELLTFLAAFVR